MIVLRRRNAFLLTMCLWTLPASSGCGDGKPSIDTSLNEATVTGVVSVKGVPATGGTILFNPSNSGRIVATRTAEIGPDGRYTIKTYTGDNQVTFGGEIAQKHMGLGLMKEYASVKAGENTIDYDLMGAGSSQKAATFDLTKKGQRRRG
ncbi:MAG TPA: hypothetical protein VFF52_05265 [Isosphaeraceae bacterium]|nr:hypothetical protein [Isosphaeraceae bacterium]